MVRRVPLLVVVSLGGALVASLVGGCGPRDKEARSPSPVVATAAPPGPQPVPTAAPTATATPAPAGTGTYGIPGLGFGLPVSPRQALVGKWTVAGIDGKSVPSAGMGTDPMDPTTYVAGSTVVFTATTVTLSKNGAPFMARDYKVLSELPPVRVVIDAGYGPSNVDFAIDGTAVWSLPSTPPHAVSMTRTP
ncbi:MAG: hypothetical protein NVS3B10_21580 [Polyangiales bacterium]